MIINNSRITCLNCKYFRRRLHWSIFLISFHLTYSKEIIYWISCYLQKEITYMYESAKENQCWQTYRRDVITFPKIVCFLSSQSHRSRVIKNWLPFVFGEPEPAHATRPRCLNLKREWNSSGNSPPYILSPPAKM